MRRWDFPWSLLSFGVRGARIWRPFNSSEEKIIFSIPRTFALSQRLRRSWIWIQHLLRSAIRTRDSFFGTLWSHFASNSFWFVFRNQVPLARRFIVWRWFEVRCKVLTLAHRMVGRTSESDRLEPTSLRLKCLSCQKRIFFNIFTNFNPFFKMSIW